MKQSTKKVLEQNKNKYTKQQIKYSFHNYLNLSNEQYLLHSLKLLGITQQQYMKETKLSMNDQIFAINAISTTTKQFFFIVLKCMQQLTTEDEFQTLKIWYMPRTVNQQLQFKKSFFNLLPKLQTKNKIPKKLLLSKNLLMGDTNNQATIQFLRILTELALRDLYIQKYSKDQRLIQIAISCFQSQEANDINKFYSYPYVPTQQNFKTALQQKQINCLKDIYKSHIQCFRKKILSVHQKLSKQQQINNYQETMSKLLEQKQINEKLIKRIPKNILSQNRAFDRRRIIDRNIQIWKQIEKVQCHFLKKQQFPVLKLQGEIDKILLNWDPPTGISKIYDCNQQLKRVSKLKQQSLRCISQLKVLSSKIQSIIVQN